MDIFHIEIKSTSEDFSLEADVTKIEKHELLTLSNPRYNQILVDEISKSLYVDDLVSGATTTEKATTLKNKATEISQDATFELHKWQSNAEELDNPSSLTQEEETYAKQQLGVPAKKNGKLLGLDWNKEDDTISISFPTEKADLTKRGILSKVARVYDPLGLVSPCTLAGKLLYREACEI